MVNCTYLDEFTSEGSLPASYSAARGVIRRAFAEIQGLICDAGSFGVTKSNGDESIVAAWEAGIGGTGGYTNQIMLGDVNSLVSADYAAVLSGASNVINHASNTPAYSVIAGGRSNQIENGYSVIGGGYQNGVNGQYSVLGGGENNVIDGDYNFIGGGDTNTITGDFNAALGSEIAITADYAVAIGRGAAAAVNGSVNIGAATSYIGFYGVTPVLQSGAIANPSGGAVIDSEARTGITSILTALRAVGLIDT